MAILERPKHKDEEFHSGVVVMNVIEKKEAGRDAEGGRESDFDDLRS